MRNPTEPEEPRAQPPFQEPCAVLQVYLQEKGWASRWIYLSPVLPPRIAHLRLQPLLSSLASGLFPMGRFIFCVAKSMLWIFFLWLLGIFSDNTPVFPCDLSGQGPLSGFHLVFLTMSLREEGP